MKVLMKPIKVYAVWDQYGKINPLAFCLEENDEKIKVQLKLESSEEQKIVGRIMINFFCRCISQEYEHNIVLRYDVMEHIWYLYKS